MEESCRTAQSFNKHERISSHYVLQRFPEARQLIYHIHASDLSPLSCSAVDDIAYDQVSYCKLEDICT